MGVNMAGYCICDDEVCREASKAEIIRRYFAAMCDVKLGRGTQGAVDKIVSLMNQAGITVDDRAVIAAALARSEQTEGQPAVAIQLNDGRIVTGKTSQLLGASSAALLNSVKALANLPDDLLTIAPSIIEPIQKLKTSVLKNHNPRLHLDETLIALSMSANTNPVAKRALDAVGGLNGCEAHSTVILSQVDQDVFRKLGVNLTCEPVYQSKKLYHK